MSDFQPGDMVVCVDATCDARRRPVPLHFSKVYKVLAVWPGIPHMQLDSLWSDTGIDLVGVPRVAGDYAYGAYRFRRLDEFDPDSIQRLTAEPVFPSPRVKEDA